MKLQAFDSKRRLTNICCLVVSLGLVKLVFGAYLLSGGTLPSFGKEESKIDPKMQALIKERERQALEIKRAGQEISVAQNAGSVQGKLTGQNTDTQTLSAQKADVRTVSEKQAKPVYYAENSIASQADLLVQASQATISGMQTKNRHSAMENSFGEQDTKARQELAQAIDSAAPRYTKSDRSFFSFVGTAHAEEVDAENYLRPDQSLAKTKIPAPTIEKPYDSPSVLSYKEAELNQKEEELLSLQEQMNSRMEELNSLENKLGEMVQQANSVEDDKYTHLIATYAAMKPRKAAEALASLDERIAVRILSGMKSKQSGEIFSYMDAVQAARLSQAMTKLASF